MFRFLLIDHFHKFIGHFLPVIDQSDVVIVHFPMDIDHFPELIVISGLMTH